MSKEESALLAAVLADPNDNGPRLVYADWLEEQGRCDRASVIRLQCEIKQLPKDAGEMLALQSRLIMLVRENEPLRRGLAYHAYAVCEVSDRHQSAYLHLLEHEIPHGVSDIRMIHQLLGQYDRGIYPSDCAQIPLLSVSEGEPERNATFIAIEAVNRSDLPIRKLRFNGGALLPWRNLELDAEGHYRLSPQDVTARITKTGIEEVEFSFGFARLGLVVPLIEAMIENPAFANLELLTLSAVSDPEQGHTQAFMASEKSFSALPRLRIHERAGTCDETMRNLMRSKLFANIIIEYGPESFEQYRRPLRSSFHMLSRDCARELRAHNEVAAEHHGIAYHPDELLATQLNKTRTWGEYLRRREYVELVQR